MDFPSFTFTGIRPAREQESAPDWDKITDSYEFEDGGRTFNEVADVAPIRWEYSVVLPAVTAADAIAAASVYHDFNNTVRRSTPFNFTDKFGTVWTNVRVESYERSHDAHKSWVVTVKFGLVSFTGENTPLPPPPEAPTGLALEVLSSSSLRATWDAPVDTGAPTVPTMNAATDVGVSSITWNWNAATDDVGVTGYDLEVAEDSGFSTGLVTHNLGNVLTYINTSLSSSQIYYARVRAHDAVPNNSAYSSSVNATTTAVADPTTIGSGLIAWLVKGVGLFQDSGKTTPASSTSDPIGAWADQSGSVTDFLQGTGGDRPLRQADGSVLFDGSNDELHTAGSFTLQPATFFCVVKFTSVAGINNLLASTGVPGCLGLTANTTTLQATKFGFALISNCSVAMTAGVDIRIIFTYDNSGNFSWLIDGVSGGTGTTAETIISTLICIGAPSTPQFLGGTLKTWGLYDNVLSGGNISSLDAYLSSL